jgi:hypothetical protein
MPLPLDAPDLERRLARAFDMHPWVKHVDRVETSHPASAVVTVTCREPVAMVRVEGAFFRLTEKLSFCQVMTSLLNRRHNILLLMVC